MSKKIVLTKKVGDINIQDIDGYTKLIHASIKGDYKTIKQLIKNGADVNIQGHDGNTALLSIFLKIISSLKDQNPPQYSKQWFEATSQEDFETIRFLLECGADVNMEFQGFNLLTFAITLGHHETIKLLLKHGLDVNTQAPLLLVTIIQGHHKTTKLLLKHRADGNAQDGNGVTALMEAVFKGYDETVKLLLKHGADVNIRNNNNETALAIAITAQNLEISRLLIEHGADIHQTFDMTINEANMPPLFKGLGIKEFSLSNASPLNLSINIGNIQLIKLLIDHGIDIHHTSSLDVKYAEEAVTYENINAFILLWMIPSSSLIKELINAIQSIKKEEIKDFFDPIETLYQKQHQIGDLLIDKGIDINQTFHLTIKTKEVTRELKNINALYHVLEYDDIKNAQYLIKKGIDIHITINTLYKTDKSEESVQGANLLDIAIKNKQFKFAELLIEKDININHKKEVNYQVDDRNTQVKGYTALISAQDNKDIKFIQLLLKNGADIEQETDFIRTDDNTSQALLGTTPLILAILDKQDDIANLLLKNNANIDKKVNDDLTLLAYAVLMEEKEAVKFCIKHGADIRTTTTEGFSLLDLTEAYDHPNPDMKMLLIKKGSPSSKDVDKQKIKNLKKKTLYLNEKDFTRLLKMNKIGNLPQKNSINELDKHGRTQLMAACENENIEFFTKLIKAGANTDIQSKEGKTVWEYASEAKNSDIFLDILKRQDELTKPTYDPKRVAELLSSFTKDTPIKYTTHRWDFGDIQSEHGGFEGFLDKVQKHWEKELKGELKRLVPSLHDKIEVFLARWQETEGLQAWCDAGNDPFDFKDFKSEIEAFKHSIEIRSENDMLEKLFLEIEEEFNSPHQIECKKLKGKQFYTDVTQLKRVLKKLFSEIEKRDKHLDIIVEVNNTTGDYIELSITHIGSHASKTPQELLAEVEGGDFADIKKSLQNLCDWSVEDNKHRINYLISEPTIPDIDPLDTKNSGFRHILRFFR